MSWLNNKPNGPKAAKEIKERGLKMQSRVERLSRQQDVKLLSEEIKRLRACYVSDSSSSGTRSENSSTSRRTIPNNSPSSNGPLLEGGPTSSETPPTTTASKSTYEMKASMVFFDPTSPQNLNEKKISVHDLTKEHLESGERNPLCEDCPPDKFRYFHLPHNHMKWVIVRSYAFCTAKAVVWHTAAY